MRDQTTGVSKISPGGDVGELVENPMVAVSINYFADNFIKIHRTWRVTPAMAAGVTSRLFDVPIW
jgi:hypothetical protein